MSCEACYSSHAKCNLKEPAPGERKEEERDGAASDASGNENGSPAQELTACSRCIKMGLICVPRTTKKRGRPRSAVSRTLDMASVQKKGKLYKDELTNAKRWTTCQAFFPQADSLQQYQAAAALASLCRELNLSKPPRSLFWYTRLMVRMAAKEKSMKLLHAASTLAVSVGLEDMTAAFAETQPVAPLNLSAACREKLDEAMQLFSSDTSNPSAPFACAYRVHIVDGDRTSFVGRNFSSMFRSADEMRREPAGHFKFWVDLLDAPEDKIKFTTSCLRNFLMSETVKNAKGQDEFYSHRGKLQDIIIRDRQGNKFMAEMDQLDVSVLVGHTEHHHIVCFSNFRHTDGTPLSFNTPAANLAPLLPPLAHRPDQFYRAAAPTPYEQLARGNEVQGLHGAAHAYGHGSYAGVYIPHQPSHAVVYDWPEDLALLDSAELLGTFATLHAELGMPDSPNESTASNTDEEAQSY